MTFKSIEIQRTKKWQQLRPQTVLLTLVAAAGLVACGSSEMVFGPPSIPSAKSAIVAPELTTSCPILASSIDSFVTKGSGPAFNGVPLPNNVATVTSNRLYF